MTYLEYVEKVRKVFRERFDAYLVEYGLEPLQKYSISEYTNHDSERSLAVYPDAPSGEVYKQDRVSETASCTVSFYLNEDASEGSSIMNLMYFDALLNFIHRQHFGEYDAITSAVLCQMESGYTYNGCGLLIESRIVSENDALYI